MSINLQTHSQRLLAAFNEVINCTSCSKWMICTYESNDGGLDVLVTEFNAGHIEYGVGTLPCAATPAHPKVVLIHWQGEGVGIQRLSACVSHVNHVKQFFKGVHVTHYARSEEDIEPAVLRRALDKVTASLNANVSDARTDDTSSQAVGSVYKRTVPSTDKCVAPDSREQFWSQKEERERRNEEHRRLAEQAQAIERDQKQLGAELHDKLQLASAPHRVSQPTPAQTAVRNGASKPQAPPPSGGDTAASFKPARSVSTAAKMFENTANQTNNVTSVASKPTAAKKWPPVGAQRPVSDDTPIVRASSPPAVPVQHVAAAEPKLNNHYIPPVPTVNSALVNNVHSFATPAPTTPAVFASTLPKRPVHHSSDDEDGDSPMQIVPVTSNNNNNHYQPPDAHSTQDDHSHKVVGNGGNQENDAALPTNTKPKPGAGLQAVALWDYTAEEDGELSFLPGEHITHIDMVDDGWWMGQSADGHRRGLFPANYVQRIN